MKRIFALGILFGATSLSVFAANFSGKWEIQTDSDAGGRGIWDGKVEGSTLSFYVWVGMDQPEKSRYRGTLSASGDEIVFEVIQGQAATAVADADSQPTRQVMARRVP